MCFSLGCSAELAKGANRSGLISHLIPQSALSICRDMCLRVAAVRVACRGVSQIASPKDRQDCALVRWEDAQQSPSGFGRLRVKLDPLISVLHGTSAAAQVVCCQCHYDDGATQQHLSGDNALLHMGLQLPVVQHS